jgi:hypothetical protein
MRSGRASASVAVAVLVALSCGACGSSGSVVHQAASPAGRVNVAASSNVPSAVAVTAQAAAAQPLTRRTIRRLARDHTYLRPAPLDAAPEISSQAALALASREAGRSTQGASARQAGLVLATDSSYVSHTAKVIDHRLCWAFIYTGVQVVGGTWLTAATVEYDDLLILIDAHSGAFLLGATLP